MKILAIVLTTLLVGCSQAPDFNKMPTVQRKESWKGGARYVLNNNGGIRGSGLGTVEFYAPDDFADVGDTIKFIDGVLKAVPSEDK